MKKTIFRVSKMDCPSEERLIRMKLNEIGGVEKVEVDLQHRRLTVYHKDDVLDVQRTVASLALGESLLSSETVIEDEVSTGHVTDERKLLTIVLGINLALFAIELATGFIAHSMGLVADSLDMLADATVYGLSLLAVGGLIATKKKVARFSGLLQMTLAVFGIAEVIRRFMDLGETPAFQMMIGISILALIGNSVSLYLLQRHKHGDVHMKASWIFTANDVLVNIGVILAGVLVFIFDSKLPDLVIGALTFALVTQAAYRILKLSR